MKQPREIWKLKLTHDYFMNGVCQWGEFRLTAESMMLLRRRQAAWIRKSISEWELVCLGDEGFADSDVLELELCNNNQEMFNNTAYDWKVDGTCCKIAICTDSDTCIDMKTSQGERVASQQRASVKLSVPLNKLQQDRLIITELNFTAKSLFVEYWLVPRDRNLNRRIVLETGNDDSKFIQIESTDVPLPSIRFRSSAPMKIRERYTEKVSLYEVLPTGQRRLLLRELPTPIIGRFPLGSEDAVVTIHYF